MIDNRIRLLWLVDSLTMGGAERLVVTFARHLDLSRFDLQVVCLKSIGGNPIAAEVEAAGASVSVLGARNLRDVAAFRRLLRFVREQEIDLIHTHLTYADIWGRIVGRLTVLPVVSTVHVPRYVDYINPRRGDRLIEGLATWMRTHCGQTVIAVSEALRQEHLSRGAPSERITTIHNGIDMGQFKISAGFSKVTKRAELGLAPDALVVITVAVLREGKAHERLLAAIPTILTARPQTKFLIVGGGPKETALREEVARCGFSEHVIFTGMRLDIAELLATADLFVLPSENDSFPTVLLEAMGMGLPVVARESGGVPEIVVDGETGLLVRSPDPSALAEGILHVLTQPTLAKQMGQRGRARVEAEFNAPGWVRKLEALYDQVLSEAGRFKTSRAQQVRPVVPRVYVVEFLGRGGMIHYAYQLCRAQASRGMDVTLVTDRDYELANLPHNFTIKRLFHLWDPKPSAPLEWSTTYRARCLRGTRRIWRALKYYGAWWQLIWYLLRTRPDIVQFGEIRFATDLVPLLLLRLGGLRLVDICHNVAPFDVRMDSRVLVKGSSLNRLIYRQIYHGFRAVFVHANANRQEFLRLYGIDPARVHVIPHGNEQLLVESSVSAPLNGALRKSLKIPEDAPVALFFGTITKYKGLEDLLEAFAQVRRALPNARLLIAGYPTDVDVTALRRQAEALQLADAVTFHFAYIPTEEVAAWFHAADVIVYPYRMVSQSGALQVAYSFGKPVIATQVGGLLEVVRHGETGLLVPPGDPAALTQAVTTLLRDRDLAKRLGQQARAWSEMHHSWDRIAQQISRLYIGLKEGAPDRLSDTAQSAAPLGDGVVSGPLDESLERTDALSR